MKRTDWCLLILTLPTANTSARMRYWRALKALGCGALRDGAYLLPRSEAHETALRDLAAGIDEGGGSTHVLYVTSADAAQEAEFRSLFDRSEDYKAFRKTLAMERRRLGSLQPGEIGRLEQRLRREFEALQATDHFPGEAGAAAASAWSEFQAKARASVSPDEPHADQGRIAQLDKAQYQGRTWATRRGLWVDRVASAWLIRRFIDPQARFVWLAKPSDCPKKALGFDFDGAAFTHVGERVTFEVLLKSFGLDTDPGLARLGELVHCLDVGEGSVAEAPGFEALMAAARQRGAGDDQLLDEMSPVLESFHAYYTTAATKGSK